jgi:hypothetical protein
MVTQLSNNKQWPHKQRKLIVANQNRTVSLTNVFSAIAEDLRLSALWLKIQFFWEVASCRLSAVDVSDIPAALIPWLQGLLHPQAACRPILHNVGNCLWTDTAQQHEYFSPHMKRVQRIVLALFKTKNSHSKCVWQSPWTGHHLPDISL